MTQLQIELLGKPTIAHDGRPISFRTRKALALLIYLVVERGSHTRAKVAALFWPESEPAAGRATLRSTLRYLRAPLAHGGDGDESPHLNVTRDALAFNFDADYRLDLERVQAAAEKRDASPPVERLQEAVDAHRGFFLEGFSLPDAPGFDEWVTLQRERWHLHLSAVYARLAQRRAAAGDTPAAIATATAWVAFDPLNEDAYRRLIRLKLAAGDRAGALQTFETCRRTLADELDVAPAPETRALAEQARARRAAPADLERHDSIPDRTRAPFPFIGRRAQHTRLTEAFFHCAERGARVVLIEGEAGIGKTRLAREFLAWAEAQESVILRGRAFETGGRLPYQPVVDALRPVTPRLPDLLSPTWLAELVRILPELSELVDHLPAPSGGEKLGRARMFEAVARAGAALSTRSPVVFFVDDLQWADAATRDLLTYAARRWREEATPLLLLVAVRAEALHRASAAEALLEWLRAMDRTAGLTRLALEALSEVELRQFVERIADPQVSPEERRAFSGWLFRETRGQPFFLTETLKALLENDVLIPGAAEAAPARFRFTAPVDDAVPGSESDPLRGFVPPGVRDVVRNRLARLSAAAFNFLVAGSVLGQEFDFESACRVADLPRSAGLEILDTLLGMRLLLETGQSAQPYAFTHDKIRDVVYTEAGDARRRLFHERALDHLREGDAPAVQLARHAYRAEAYADAFRYTLQAGDDAMDLFAVRDAIFHFRNARRVLRENPRLDDTVDTGRRRHLYERLGRGYELVNAWEKAQETYREMLAYGRASGLPRIEVAALNRLATVRIIWQLDPDGALPLLDDARQVAEANDDRRGLAEAEWATCLSKFYRFERPAALQHGRRAVDLAREVGERRLIAKCLNVTGYAASGVNLWEDVEAFGAEAREIYAALSNQALEVDSLLLVAFARTNMGQPRFGVRLGEEAVRVTREIENEWGEANARNHLAASLLEVGEYGRALETVQHIFTLQQLKEAPQFMAALTIRGLVYWVLQDFERALADHRAADEHIHRLGNPGMLRVLSTHLCADYVALHQWEKAYEMACVARQTKDFGWYYAGFRYWNVTLALLRGGDERAATRDVALLEEAVGQYERYRIVIARCRAVLQEWQDDPAGAVTQLERALALADTMSLPGEQWPLLAELGRLYRGAGDEAAAADAQERAGRIVNRLASTIDDPELRDSFLHAPAVQRL